MHPLYLADFIANLKEQLRRDITIVNEQLAALAKTEDETNRSYNAIDLKWQVTHLSNSAQKLQHDLLQIKHIVEKLEQNGK